jgi:hypothetical protein
MFFEFIAATRRYVDKLLVNHYFQPEAAPSLSLFRFLYCASLFWTIYSSGAAYVKKFDGTTWYPTPLFELLHIPLISAELFQAVQHILLAALALTALGVFTRASASVACGAFFLYMGTYLGFGKSPHTNYVVHSQNIVPFVLGILAIAPGVSVYGFDGWRMRNWRWRVFSWPETPGDTALISAWPRNLIMLTLGLAYFGAGYCKLASHLLWADGHTLQGHLLSKHLLVDSPAGAWVAQSYWLCLFLQIATLVLELGFFAVVYFPRWRWLFVLSAIGFHSSIYATMHINFFPYFGSTLLVFLDWPTVLWITAPLRALARQFVQQPGGKPSPTAAATPTVLPRPLFVEQLALGDTLWARRVIVGLATLLFVCVIARVEAWPFTDYRVFTDRLHPSEVRVHRLAALDGEGNLHWIPKGWVRQSPTTINSRVRAHLAKQDEAAIKDLLRELGAHVAAKDTEGRFHRVVFVERTLARSVDHRLTLSDVPTIAANAESQVTATETIPGGGTYVSLDRPVFRARLRDTVADDEPSQVAEAEGDTILR